MHFNMNHHSIQNSSCRRFDRWHSSFHTMCFSVFWISKTLDTSLFVEVARLPAHSACPSTQRQTFRTEFLWLAIHWWYGTEVQLYIMESDKVHLTPATTHGGGCQQIRIYSRNKTIEIVFYTGRTLDEIREGRRRGELRLDQRRREERSQFWENHHARWGTTMGQEYL